MLRSIAGQAIVCPPKPHMAIAPKLETKLREWTAASLIDATTAARIHDFEDARRETRLRWPIVLAVAFGALLMGAGVLLFVAAHWNSLPPGGRFTLVLLMVGFFHVAGAFAAEHFAKMATALHAVGTITLGAGIALGGQIFNLQEHWPGGVLMWALGAWLGWLLLRDFPQLLLAGILTPAWLGSEWAVATDRYYGNGPEQIMVAGICLLSVTYISLRKTGERDLPGRALSFVGCLALLPAAFVLVLESTYRWWNSPLPFHLRVIGWSVAIIVPVLLAVPFRRRKAWMNAVAMPWLFLGMYLSALAPVEHNAVLPLWAATSAALFMAWGIVEDRAEFRFLAQLGFGLAAVAAMIWASEDKSFLGFLVCLAACIAWCWYGTRFRQRAMINAGIACVGITVMFFYFSEIMDKLDRSLSLIILGVLFLVGGWLLERTRRRLVAMAKGAAA